MSSIRVTNIQAKADASSPTIDEKVRVLNSQGTVVMQIDGKTSGITTVGINTTGNTFTVNNNDVIFAGIVSSTGGFSGNLTNVTSMNNGPLSGTRNIVINGAMDINQRGFTGSAGTTTNGAYVTDRFALGLNHDGVVSAGQTGMGTTTGGNAYADGFQNALILRVTTADASLGAAQYQTINQAVEGFNLQGIKKGTVNALPVTLSFWCRSTTTGTYIVELYDNNNVRDISQAYTINTANTWEKKVLTFPADTIGTLNNDNGAGLIIQWWLAAGSTYSSGTLNTSWAAVTTANRAVGQTNLLATAGNNFWLTGVQLEVGSVATPFERRSYGQELALCQRYFQTYDTNTFCGVNKYPNVSLTAGAMAPSFLFPVEMRASPSSLPSKVNITIDTWGANPGIAKTLDFNTITSKSFELSYLSGSNGGTSLGINYFGWYNNTIQSFSSEL